MKNTSLLNMARNALLSAGYEIGAEGAHWNVIKSALASLARSYEALKIEEEVTEQLRLHMKSALDNYDHLLQSFANDIEPEVMTELKRFMTDLRDVYDARFDISIDDEDMLADLNSLAREFEGILPAADAALLLNQRRTGEV